MDTVTRLLELSSRIEHLEQAAEWIAKEAVHTDSSVSQTGTLICVLADDIREKIYSLVHELEEEVAEAEEATTFSEDFDKMH